MEVLHYKLNAFAILVVKGEPCSSLRVAFICFCLLHYLIKCNTWHFTIICLSLQRLLSGFLGYFCKTVE